MSIVTVIVFADTPHALEGVTVKTVTGWTCVGIPEIPPVDVLNAKPVASVPPEMANDVGELVQPVTALE